ncbi:TonB family protein [Psychrobacter sp. DAB_AL43B]|uniref:TonB family protein n=1 Tax=Psychrobacter sp. DAB_AL43B TaxID=1028416 RepID=UPI001557C86D|nr:TonB family protein [Psychrobacter sp. DAB_AL43B]
MAIKPSAPKVALPKETPPIEIQMVTLPAEIKEPEVAMDTAEPVKPIQPQPKSVATTKPKIAKESQPLAKTKPAAKPAATSENPKTKTQPDTTKAVENEPFKHKVKPQESISTVQADALAADNERKILAAQAEKAAQEAQRLADAKTAREAQALADAKAGRDAQAKADAKKAQEIADAKAKAAAAASNEPVNYGNIGKSSWLREPIFTSIRDKDYGFQGTKASVTVSMSVDSNGNIGNIKISKSSGKNKFDTDFIRALSKAKLNPATRDNIPTKSTAILPFEMNL